MDPEIFLPVEDSQDVPDATVREVLAGLIGGEARGGDGADLPDRWEPHVTLTLGRLRVVHAEKGEPEDAFIVEGMASTSELNSFGQIVEPGAFRGTLRRFMRFPVVLFSHTFMRPIGRVLRAEIRDTGLWVRAMISSTAQDIRTLITEGVLKAFSIGFWVEMEDIKRVEGTDNVRITKLELLEISVVPVPANRASTFKVAMSLQSRLGVPAAPAVGEVKGAAPDALAQEIRNLVHGVVSASADMAVAGARLSDAILAVGEGN